MLLLSSEVQYISEKIEQINVSKQQRAVTGFMYMSQYIMTKSKEKVRNEQSIDKDL